MEGHCKIMYLFFYQLSSEPDREVILCISVLQNLEIEPRFFKLSSEIVCGKGIFGITIFQDRKTLSSGILNLIAHKIDAECIFGIALPKVGK